MATPTTAGTTPKQLAEREERVFPSFPQVARYFPGASIEDYCRACKTDRIHTIVVVDPEGQLAALFNTPHDAGAIARDYRRIVAAR